MIIEAKFGEINKELNCDFCVTSVQNTNGYIEKTFVKSVNGVTPDKNGNVEVAVSCSAEVAFTAGYNEPITDSYIWCDTSNGGENTPETVTLVEMDFDNGSVDGWYDNPATPYSSIPEFGKRYTTRNVVGNALEIMNYTGNGYTYLQQYNLGKSVDNAVLECKFSLRELSKGHMSLCLPVLLYEGTVDNATDFGNAPLGLYVMCMEGVPALFYNYGRGIERGKAAIATLGYYTVYTLRVEYDLPTKSVKVFLDGNELTLPDTGLEAGCDSSIIVDSAKLNRISLGAHSATLTWAYVDDIKVTYEDRNPTNAVGLLTTKNDGVKQYIYPVTKPEAVEGLQDYIVAQGTSDIWTYRKWASGIAECWCTRTLQVNITTACGGAYCSDFLGVDLFPFTFVETPKCFAQVQARNNTVWPVAADVAANIFPPMYKLVSPIQVSNLSATIEHYVVGRWK